MIARSDPDFADRFRQISDFNRFQISDLLGYQVHYETQILIMNRTIKIAVVEKYTLFVLFFFIMYSIDFGTYELTD